jgi:protein-S-isoprenylcysteine O-methyltransferase Ste14
MTADDPALRRQALQATAQFLVALAVLLLLPAWTLLYWQAWLYLVVFGTASIWATLYFLKHDPALVVRRMAAGPGAEKEKSQKRIMTAASACIIALFVVPGLDHLFGWSAVPTPIVLLADIGVVLGYYIIFIVLKENSYASATIETGRDQLVVATGPYALVRHPMYSGALIMFGATPLALGSYWGLLLVIPLAGVLAWRLFDEEQFLIRKLRGYVAYRQDVRYRLIPGIW